MALNLRSLDKLSTTLKALLAGSLPLAAGTIFDRLANLKGELILEKQTALALLWAIMAVFSALACVTWELWRKANKRHRHEERIRFAKKMGQPVCWCDGNGEPMTYDPIRAPIPQADRNWFCWRCGRIQPHE